MLISIQMLSTSAEVALFGQLYMTQTDSLAQSLRHLTEVILQLASMLPKIVEQSLGASGLSSGFLALLRPQNDHKVLTILAIRVFETMKLILSKDHQQYP